MLRSIVLSWHILHQRGSTTSVQEVDRDTGVATIVGRSQTSIEVRYKVDFGAVVCSVRVQDTGNGDSNVGLRVVADDGSVYQER